MQSLQISHSCFNSDTLAVRDKIEQLEISRENIEDFLNLLKLPFINGVYKIYENKYILTIGIKDIANIFFHLSNLLMSCEKERD